MQFLRSVRQAAVFDLRRRSRVFMPSPSRMTKSTAVRLPYPEHRSPWVAKAAVASTLVIASAYYCQDGDCAQPFQRKEPARADARAVAPPSFVATARSSANFQILNKLEAKEERQKLKAALFLRDIHDMAQETKKALVRRYSSRLVDRKSNQNFILPQSKKMPSRGGRLALSGLNLQKISPQEAEKVIESLFKGRRLDRESLLNLADAATEVLAEEPTVIDLRNRKEDFVVVGDLHGDLLSLKTVLDMAGDLENKIVVVTGDYIDRGESSLEVFCTLLLLKLSHPDNVFLLRGNHEDTMVCSVYGFLEEIQKKYGFSKHRPIWDRLSDLFAALPIAARTETALMLHGGLPSNDFKLSDLESVSAKTRCKSSTVVGERNAEEKLLETIMWSDPSFEDGIQPFNSRGCGVEFGPDVARDFLDRHGLKYLVRSHQPVEQGAEFLDCGNGCGVITVFSAAGYPNGEGSNEGSILTLSSSGEVAARQFTFDRPSTTAVAEAEPYEEALRSSVEDNRLKLARAFQGAENSNGTITSSQWADIMAEQLELPDVPWKSIQPTVAPTVEPDSNVIDWRHYLRRNSAPRPDLDILDEEKAHTLHKMQDKMLSIFQFLDSDASGTIDRKEFLQGMEILNRDHLPVDKRIDKPQELFNAIDVDGNGEIDIEEFTNALEHSIAFGNVARSLDEGQVGILHQNRDMLLTAFKFLDTDGNGLVDYREFSRGVELLNKRLPENQKLEDPKALFEALDVDGSGEIDLEEFNHIFQGL